jgi:hypothetical protein
MQSLGLNKGALSSHESTPTCIPQCSTHNSVTYLRNFLPISRSNKKGLFKASTIYESVDYCILVNG